MPPLGRHGVCDIVDVEITRAESKDADERVTENFELGAEGGMFADAVGQFLGCADDLFAGGEVAGFADGHEGGPASGDEGAGTGAGNARGGVDAAGPGGVDKVLVGAEGGGAVQDGGVSFGGEAVFVCVAADGGDAAEAEVKRDGVEARFGEEGDEEGAETAVYVERDAAFDGEAGEGGDVVDDAVREVGGGADEEDCVAVD